MFGALEEGQRIYMEGYQLIVQVLENGLVELQRVGGVELKGDRGV